jgi:hypothetical protein
MEKICRCNVHTEGTPTAPLAPPRNPYTFAPPTQAIPLAIPWLSLGIQPWLGWDMLYYNTI